MKYKKLAILALTILVSECLSAQTADALIERVRAKLDKVSDYQATGRMKTNVTFIKAPIARVRVFYKKPDRLRINNESGISFIPKGSFNINVGNIFLNTAGYDIIDAGKEGGSQLRIIKLLPKDENSDIVLSTIFIDEGLSVIRKAKITTKENGTYELEMFYGKYADYGLADKVIFSFNTKDYKVPKGVVFDYDGGQKKDAEKKLSNKKGKVEIYYANYVINKGFPDSVFQ
jgi:hypothetical protein